MLTPTAVATIRTTYQSGRATQQALADQYGVTQPMISRIVNKHDRSATYLDFPITPAIKAYLKAFDEYLMATKIGNTKQARAAAAAKQAALTHLEDKP